MSLRTGRPPGRSAHQRRRPGDASIHRLLRAHRTHKTNPHLTIGSRSIVCLFVFLFVCLFVGWLVGWFVGLVWVFESVTIVSLFLLLLQNWVSLGVTPISSSLDVSVLNSHDNGIPRRLRVSPSAVYNHPPPHPPPVFVPSPPSSSSFPSTVQQRTPSVVSSTNTFVTFFLKIPIFLSFFLFLSIYLSIHPSISLYLYLSLSLSHTRRGSQKKTLVGWFSFSRFVSNTNKKMKKNGDN